MRNAHKLGSFVCFSAALAFVGCGSGDDSSPSGTGASGGSSTGLGGSSGAGGSFAGTANVGTGGTVAGQSAGGTSGSTNGGSVGASGSAGTNAGSGGAAAGSGGASGGSAGASAGSGGSSAGTAGASAGSGGASAGTAGASAGSGGTTAGAGGTSAGSGGTSAGTGGDNGGTGGASAGSGGDNSGTGGDNGGTGGASAGSGGASGSAGSSAGGSGGSGGACPVPPYITVFDFADGSTINSNPDGTASAATNPGEALGKWTRSRFGSTANGVAGLDGDANNLAKISSLAFEPSDGNPDPGSLKATIPFTGTLNETLGLVYAISSFQDTIDLADVSGRMFSANVKLVSTPRTNCTFTATAWSTADSGSTTGVTFNESAGTPVTLTTGQWVTATFDLDNSADKLRVNQVGIDLKSSCTGTTTGTDATVIEVDHATLLCK
ncbi:MAG TPA: hypothetical protein VGM44_24135 [Polyangiaceae bacterium]